MPLTTTPSQTVGPFFSIGLEWLTVENIAGPEMAGERMRIAGRVLDGDGTPVPDAVIEIWQASPEGKYAQDMDKGFLGFGRVATDDQGEFRFSTVKPGSVPGPDGKMQAPHLAVSVFMRGLLDRLVTRIYFPDDSRNAEDFVLNLVEPERRGTLIARKVGGSTNCLEWNVILQGNGETVFFEC